VGQRAQNLSSEATNLDLQHHAAAANELAVKVWSERQQQSNQQPAQLLTHQT
jgi:hypothetical protein